MTTRTRAGRPPKQIRYRDGYVFHESLVCGIERIEYDFLARTGTLHLPAGSCTDMGGAIALVSGVDPGARAIVTYSGDVPDVRYVRDPGRGGRWHAYLPTTPTPWPSRERE